MTIIIIVVVIAVIIVAVTTIIIMVPGQIIPDTTTTITKANLVMPYKAFTSGKLQASSINIKDKVFLSNLKASHS